MSSDQLENRIRAMSDTLIHRGPDHNGTWIDAACGIALGFRRLSILDLTPAGNQPMTSHDGRYVIVFNGEIYNHREIRKELESTGAPVDSSGLSPSAPMAWNGHSDTEVMLEAIGAWGVEEALKRFTGMFAFGLWDRKERELVLARDRMGEKPLYYGWNGEAFLFGSELKALRAFSGEGWEINREALCLYLRYNHVPCPGSIYKGIRKLAPANFLKMNERELRERTWRIETYWDMRAVAENGARNPFCGSDREAIEELDSLIRSSVRQQMVADVPLGAFLSGGVDSSTVVSLMQAQSTRPVRTFTIGFFEDDYNEAVHAKEVADHLGTDHTELYMTADEAMAIIPRLPVLYDEPFSDSSQIPTFLVSEMARRHVKVSLSGDGGDELFGGYNRYSWGPEIWKKISWLPLHIRRILSEYLKGIRPDRLDSIFRRLDPFLPPNARQPTPGDKLHKIADILNQESPEALYRRLISGWQNPSDIVLHVQEPATIVTDRSRWADLPDIVRQMMYLDAVSYLPDDILVKVDRASMGVSLEARVPMLDHRIVEFAWQLPVSMKLRNGPFSSKWILRQVLYRYVPRDLIERPKTGFAVPIDQWLRGPLRQWAEALLDVARLKREGFFDPEPIRQKWSEHLQGKRNWQYDLWYILMFEAWLEAQRA